MLARGPRFLRSQLCAASAFFRPRLFGFCCWSGGFRGRRRRAALDADLEIRHDVGMKAEFDFMVAQGPNWVIQMDLPFIKRDLKLRLKLVSDHASRDRAEHFAVL